jgi:hypothetical protein
MPSTASRSTRKTKRLWKALFQRGGLNADREQDELLALPPVRGSVSRFVQTLRDRFIAMARRVAPARRPRILPVALRARPWLLISYTVFLVCLIAIVIGWRGQPAADPADFDLHADNSSFNLEENSAEEPAKPAVVAPQPTFVQELPPPPKVEGPVIPAREIPPVVQVKTEDPIPDMPPPPQEQKGPADVPPPAAPKLDTPPAIVPDAIQLTEAVPVPQPILDPEVSDPICDWHQGDVPMIRNWHKVLGYQTVLAAAIMAGQAGAGNDGKGNSDKPAPTDLKAIKEQLDKIEESTKAMGAIRLDLGGLKREIELLRKSNTSEFEAVNKRVAELEKKLASLEGKLNTRVANFPPANGPGVPPTGRMRLVNGFNRRATIFLNDMPHPLEPGQVEELNFPAGNYSFWVLVDGFAMVQPPTPGTLTAGGSRTIEIFTR